MTSGTLADLLDVVEPYLPDCLVPQRDVERILTIARELPATLTTGVGFECHLGPPPPHADFLVRVRAAEVGRQVLAGTSSLGALSERLTAVPAWGRMREFARTWADPVADPTANTHNVWLEFDIDPDEDGMPVPGVFFSAYHGVPSRLHQSPPPAPVDAYGWVTRDALPKVFGRPLAAVTEQRLFAALDALPPGANVFQFGVMLSRSSDAVRLCIARLRPELVLAYLEELGWEPDEGELGALVDRLAGLVDQVVLAVDLGERLGDRIGFECYFDEFGQPGEEPRWRQLLDHLVESGHCRPEQRDALLGWPGYTTQAAAGEAWPTHLAAAASLFGPRAESGIARVLHHVKVAHQPGRPLSAKAYLGATHHWH